MMRPLAIAVGAFALVFTVAGASAARHSARTASAPAAASELAAAAHERTVIQVYKSPTCGCCAAWVEHVRAAGFVAEVIDEPEAALQARKSRLGVGPKLASCHTAIVNGYVVEGHVPAADIQRMLREKPAIAGIAAPGMPVGSPGMEVPSGAKDRYDVVAFTRGGTTKVYATH